MWQSKFIFLCVNLKACKSTRIPPVPNPLHGFWEEWPWHWYVKETRWPKSEQWKVPKAKVEWPTPHNIHLHTHTHITHTCLHMHTCKHMHTCPHVRTHAHTHIHTRTHTHTFACMYACTHICTHHSLSLSHTHTHTHTHSLGGSLAVLAVMGRDVADLGVLGGGLTGGGLETDTTPLCWDDLVPCKVTSFCWAHWGRSLHPDVVMPALSLWTPCSQNRESAGRKVDKKGSKPQPSSSTNKKKK